MAVQFTFAYVLRPDSFNSRRLQLIAAHVRHARPASERTLESIVQLVKRNFKPGRCRRWSRNSD
jgi:hypothetical protein